jgi:hypothetical protein
MQSRSEPESLSDVLVTVQLPGLEGGMAAGPGAAATNPKTMDRLAKKTIPLFMIALLSFFFCRVGS